MSCTLKCGKPYFDNRNGCMKMTKCKDNIEDVINDIVDDNKIRYYFVTSAAKNPDITASDPYWGVIEQGYHDSINLFNSHVDHNNSQFIRTGTIKESEGKRISNQINILKWLGLVLRPYRDLVAVTVADPSNIELVSAVKSLLDKNINVITVDVYGFHDERVITFMGPDPNELGYNVANKLISDGKTRTLIVGIEDAWGSLKAKRYAAESILSNYNYDFIGLKSDEFLDDEKTKQAILNKFTESNISFDSIILLLIAPIEGVAAAIEESKSDIKVYSTDRDPSIDVFMNKKNPIVVYARGWNQYFIGYDPLLAGITHIKNYVHSDNIPYYIGNNNTSKVQFTLHENPSDIVEEPINLSYGGQGLMGWDFLQNEEYHVIQAEDKYIGSNINWVEKKIIPQNCNNQNLLPLCGFYSLFHTLEGAYNLNYNRNQNKAIELDINYLLDGISLVYLNEGYTNSYILRDYPAGISAYQSDNYWSLYYKVLEKSITMKLLDGTYSSVIRNNDGDALNITEINEASHSLLEGIPPLQLPTFNQNIIKEYAARWITLLHKGPFNFIIDTSGLSDKKVINNKYHVSKTEEAHNIDLSLINTNTYILLEQNLSDSQKPIINHNVTLYTDQGCTSRLFNHSHIIRTNPNNNIGQGNYPAKYNIHISCTTDDFNYIFNYLKNNKIYAKVYQSYVVFNLTSINRVDLETREEFTRNDDISPDHAVTAVGVKWINIDNENRPFMLIKNSWGNNTGINPINYSTVGNNRGYELVDMWENINGWGPLNMYHWGAIRFRTYGDAEEPNYEQENIIPNNQNINFTSHDESITFSWNEDLYSDSYELEIKYIPTNKTISIKTSSSSYVLSNITNKIVSARVRGLYSTNKGEWSNFTSNLSTNIIRSSTGLRFIYSDDEFINGIYTLINNTINGQSVYKHKYNNFYLMYSGGITFNNIDNGNTNIGWVIRNVNYYDNNDYNFYLMGPNIIVGSTDIPRQGWRKYVNNNWVIDNNITYFADDESIIHTPSIHKNTDNTFTIDISNTSAHYFKYYQSNSPTIEEYKYTTPTDNNVIINSITNFQLKNLEQNKTYLHIISYNHNNENNKSPNTYFTMNSQNNNYNTCTECTNGYCEKSNTCAEFSFSFGRWICPDGNPPENNCNKYCDDIVDECGICGGNSIVDECGVCNGDNSTCKGCDGKPNSGLVLDDCNICGGPGKNEVGCCNNETRDCEGTCGGSATNNNECNVCIGGTTGLSTYLNEHGCCGFKIKNTCGECVESDELSSNINQCGFCGQDNVEGILNDGTCSKCADGYSLNDCGYCIGNGLDNTLQTGKNDDGCCGTQTMICGVCGGNVNEHDCCGNQIKDDCGICGGQNEKDHDTGCCLNNPADDCGVCGGQNEKDPDTGCCLNNPADECGICGGNNSTCLGCDGIPNSGLVLDGCGVCNGSGKNDDGCCGTQTIDECGICGGQGIHEDYCDCDKTIKKNICNKCEDEINKFTNISGEICDCDGNVVDECGVCNGKNTCKNINNDSCFDHGIIAGKVYSWGEKNEIYQNIANHFGNSNTWSKLLSYSNKSVCFEHDNGQKYIIKDNVWVTPETVFGLLNNTNPDLFWGFTNFNIL